MGINRLVVEGVTYLQATVGVLSLLAYLPQWRTLLRTRSSANIALGSWAVWSLSSLIATVYAVVQLLLHGTGWALVFSASSNLLFVLVTVMLIARFRQR
ncbi:PQ-loop domain-containing transporter [Chitinilyticum piscinae]|uniref:PQ loop repeat protein n=1 Tax=Chitinilyticum piscinae TaxID=2866724 RepID=A0A8J7K1R5_9NEIS|nr:PQ-loop domain-containing transporter [Chitinilyticum piscinae]MBE9609022.1 hypothetical protein [Chitinilyticum piscinae]